MAGSYDKYLMAQLKNPIHAAGYLNACIESGIADDLSDKDMKAVILESLKNVVEAHGGTELVSGESGISSKTLYQILSGKGNPSLTNLIKLSQGLGMTINWQAKDVG